MTKPKQIQMMEASALKLEENFYKTCGSCGATLSIRPLNMSYSHTKDNYLNEEKIPTIKEIVSISSEPSCFLVTCPECTYCRRAESEWEVELIANDI